jgi:hypothetical protein
MSLPCVCTQPLLARALRYEKVTGEAMKPSPIPPKKYANSRMAVADYRNWRNLCPSLHKPAIHCATNYYERTAKPMREFQNELERSKARRFGLVCEGA